MFKMNCFSLLFKKAHKTIAEHVNIMRKSSKIEQIG